MLIVEINALLTINFIYSKKYFVEEYSSTRVNELASKLSTKEKEFLDLRNAHAKLQKVPLVHKMLCVRNLKNTYS